MSVETCFVYGINYYGDDINKTPLQTNSADQCQQKCQETSKCKYWTWDPNYKNSCWLKTGKGNVRSNKRYKHVVSGPKHCYKAHEGNENLYNNSNIGRTHEVKKTLMSMENCFDYHMDYPGNDIKKHFFIPTISANDCRKKCQKKSNCNYWTWDPTWNNACWLKTAKGSVETKKHLVSGPKHCYKSHEGNQNNYNNSNINREY